jgi:hypothetical protein
MYLGRPKFTRGVGEDLENNFTCYDATMAMTGMISEIAKINRMVNTVDKAAARFYLNCFLEGLHIYGSKRNNKIEKYFEDQRLGYWNCLNRISLRIKMRENPEKSQIKVFREIVYELVSIQSQLAEN